MKKTIIDFQNFSFQYQAQQEPTLKNINLQISEGEKVLIIGPSGSGKSTLAQCLNGLIPSIYPGQASGKLEIAGKKAFDLSIYDKSNLVSTVLQDTDGQFIGLSVAEDLAFALENDMLPQDQMKEKVAEWAERLDLKDLLQHRPQDLSGGQKQRVSLAGVLVDESPILLFDEPLANLDPKSGQDIIDLIDRLHKESQATTIIIEHRLEDVLYRQVDRIVLVNGGSILFNGSPNQLLASDLLIENGIREPLYLTVCKALGLDLAAEQGLSDLAQLDLSSLAVKEIPLPQESPLTSREELLKVEGLAVSYGERQILSDVNLTFYKGERLAIIGRNGAGKSTLAKALAGFLPAEGRLTYKGEDITDDSLKERGGRIGYVLQNPNQMISKTMIYDEVAEGLRLQGLDEAQVEEKVLATLKVCGLYPFRKWPISALSYGQKKRVTIASILVLGPEVILLDEPTAGQDQKNYQEIMRFLDHLRDQGHTIIMITHDMQLMQDYSDRSLVLLDGKVIADMDPLELLSQKDLLEQAYLKETSIYQLAEKIDVDPVALSRYYKSLEERKEKHV